MSEIDRLVSRMDKAEKQRESNFMELRDALSDLIVLQTQHKHVSQEVTIQGKRVLHLELELARMKTEMRWLTGAGAVVVSAAMAWIKGLF